MFGQNEQYREDKERDDRQDEGDCKKRKNGSATKLVIVTYKINVKMLKI